MSDESQRWRDLLRDPREEVRLEIKSWLDLSDNEDRANLAKAMLALANTGGGQILIGYKEVGGSWQPDTSLPHSIDHYNQDEINGIVEKFADPQFHCAIYHVEHPSSDDLFPIIDVPGDHKVPIRAQRGGPDGQHVTYNEYYIRRPGPESAPPKTGREWDELIRRCVAASKDELVGRIRNMITGLDEEPGAEERDPLDDLQEWTDKVHARWQERVEEEYSEIAASLYRDGHWMFAYSLEGDFAELSLSNFREILREVKGHETGWPPWAFFGDTVYPHEDAIEAWVVDHDMEDPSHADFWRASPAGNLFLLRGYEEDSQEDVEPGEVMDFVLPVWRIGECLLHAKRLGHELCDGTPSVAIEVQWTGVDGRKLSSIYSRGGLLPPVQHQSHQETVTAQNVFSVEDIEDNLPEVVERLTQPLYQTFGFYESSSQMIREQLDKMQGT